MKRTWIVVLAVCIAVLFTACGKSSKNIETAASTAAASTAQETKAGEADEPSHLTNSQEASLEAPGSEEEFKILTGKIVSLGDSLESMTLFSGSEEISIELKDVIVETTYALDVDEEVNVIYKGEISGSDISNARFLMVVDGQKGLKVQEITGNVVEQAMSTFAIETEEGTKIYFMKDNCEGLNSGVLGEAEDDSNGSGAVVKVTYVTVGYDTDKTNFPLKVESGK